MSTDEIIKEQCVLDNGTLRDPSMLEDLLIDWSFGRQDNAGTIDIGYATATHEPYRAEWFEDAKSAFIKSIMQKLSTRDLAILELLGLISPELKNQGRSVEKA